MKRRSATRFSSGTLDMPVIAKTLPRVVNPRFKKTEAMQEPVPPSEETIKRLNDIGKEYPFCVYFKHKHFDPL